MVAGPSGGQSDVADLVGQNTGDELRQQTPPKAHLPHFTADGKLLRPQGWESWVLAGTSIGLTYS